MELQSQSWEYPPRWCSSPVHMISRRRRFRSTSSRTGRGASRTTSARLVFAVGAAWINLARHVRLRHRLLRAEACLFLLLLGCLLTLPATFGPLPWARRHLAQLDVARDTLPVWARGLSARCVAQVLHDRTGRARRPGWGVSYTRSVIVGAPRRRWPRLDRAAPATLYRVRWTLGELSAANSMAITGLLLIIMVISSSCSRSCCTRRQPCRDLSCSNRGCRTRATARMARPPS